jgi:hypothetical protein
LFAAIVAWHNDPGKDVGHEMKWILVVLAITADSEAILEPRDVPRSGMASALRALYIERELLKDVHDGVAFDSRTACRAAIQAIEARAPDAENTPQTVSYKRICKRISREDWS